MAHAEPPRPTLPDGPEAALPQCTALIQIDIALCHLPGQCDLIRLQLPDGTKAGDALRAAGLAQRVSAALLDSLALSLWGRACGLDQPLAQGDRLALTRALLVDPKEARRQRYQRDGVRKPLRQRVKRPGAVKAANTLPAFESPAAPETHEPPDPPDPPTRPDQPGSTPGKAPSAAV